MSPLSEADSARPASAALERLNEAEFEELRSMRLSVSQAQRLLAYRDRHGGLVSLDELDTLGGLSRAAIADLKETLAGAKPPSPQWVSHRQGERTTASTSVVARPPAISRRHRPRRDGLLLFAGFSVAAACLVALAYGALRGPKFLSGACMIVIGIAVIAAYRELAEVRASLDLIRSRILNRLLAIIAGASLIASGIIRILG